MRHLLSPAAVTFLLAIALAAQIPEPASASYRDGEAVVVPGTQLPLWSGKALGEIFAYVYDSSLGQWTRRSLQIDERHLRRLATCLDDTTRGNVDYELSYAFEGPEGDGLGVDDELVLRWRDAGDPAPPTSWVAGTEATRYEIALTDPLALETRYLYLYSASSPPHPDPGLDDVQYAYAALDTLLENTQVSGSTYDLHFGARWRVDSLSVKPGAGGSGQDLIDRIKFREATNLPEAQGGETEETWDRFSCYQGDIDGPIRAIRGIQGAASGVNTTCFFYFYGDRIKWQFNIRVHPVPNVVNMVDFDSGVVPLTYYNEWNPGGFPIDGFDDPAMNTALSHWDEAVSPTHGGLVVVREEPIPVPAANTISYWWDDSAFADQTGADEPGRYGCPGFVWLQIADTDTPGNEARACLTYVPLPAGTASVGAQVADAVTNPVAVDVDLQDQSTVAVPEPPGGGAVLRMTPNPVVGDASIRFALPADARGRLQVFDLTGRLLWSREVSGSGVCTWPADNQESRDFPPGVYWLRLTAAGIDPLPVRTIRFVKLD